MRLVPFPLQPPLVIAVAWKYNLFSESRAKEPVPDASCGTSHAVTKRARGKKTFNPTFVKYTFHLDRVSVLVLCCAYVFNIY